MNAYDEFEQRYDSIIGYEEKKPIYLPIHVIPPGIKSECPYFRLSKVMTKSGKEVYVAECEILGRYLTRSHVEKCIRLWRECPFYNYYQREFR